MSTNVSAGISALPAGHDLDNNVENGIIDDRDITEAIKFALTSKLKLINGSDSDGYEYDSIEEMWHTHGILPTTSSGITSRTTKGRDAWYKKASDYWQDELNAPATIDGVLGGYESISKLDLEGSRRFLLQLKQFRPSLQLGGEHTCACECGAGIGRVSKGLLLPLGINRCDLVEASSRLLNAAPEYLGTDYATKCRYLCMGLQDFDPEPFSYDVVWIQWVIGYLTDLDCVKFLKRMAKSMRQPGGVIVLKDNTCSANDEAFQVDVSDSSLTRSLPYLLVLAEQAGLRVVLQRMQDNFPEDLFPVPMIAFEVAADTNSNSHTTFASLC